MLSPQPQTQISDQAAEQLLHGLVNTPSPSTHEQAAVTLLVNWMRAHGYDEAYTDEAGNAVGIIGQGERDIILLGHIDTFSGNPPAHQVGRLLYGRGTVDAKGPLATFAVAGVQAQLPPNVRLIVVGAVEEEAASSKGARHIATQFQPAACIIGEPSNWDRITLGYKGRLLLDWSWTGPLAHSAGPVLSPAEQAVAYWQQVQTYTAHINTDRESLFGRLDATLQHIHSAIDGAFGHAQATVGFRLPPDLSPQLIAEALQPESPQATVRAYGMENACVAERDTLLSRAMRKGIRAEGGTPRFVYKTGTADMNIVAPIWNCPILAYGPGDSALDHCPDEHINLDEYLQAIRVLTHALNSLSI